MAGNYLYMLYDYSKVYLLTTSVSNVSEVSSHWVYDTGV